MRITLTLLLLLTTLLGRAQAFQGGETLEYKMYFNWQFIWLNAGTATMTIHEREYQGRKAFRCALTTRSSQKIDRYFRMRDTLLCYTTPECLPLYYRKGASEGKRYYVDELLYSYDNGVHVTMRELTSHGERLQQQHSFKKPVYDMLSNFLIGLNLMLHIGDSFGNTIAPEVLTELRYIGIHGVIGSGGFIFLSINPHLRQGIDCCGSDDYSIKYKQSPVNSGTSFSFFMSGHNKLPQII